MRFRFGRQRRLRSPAQFAALREVEPRFRAGRRWLAIAMAQVEADAPLQGTGGGQVQSERVAQDPERMVPPVPGQMVAQVPGQRVAHVRFGVTVGRRHARRSVQRSLVKRILREAMRHSASRFERAAVDSGLGIGTGRGIDVVLRLKSRFPEPGEMSLVQFKRALRSEADTLLELMCARLAAAAIARP